MERRKVCRYFERGSCKKDDCPFVHIKENRKTCNFYLEGNCKRGATCNFYHPPKEEQKLANLKAELQKKPWKKTQEQQANQSDEDQYQEKVEQMGEKIQNLQLDNSNQEHQDHEDYKQDQNQEENQQKHEKQPFEQIAQISEKMERINFLLGLNHNHESQSEEEEINVKQQVPEKKALQFFKIYPKKFIDQSKFPETKAFVLQNEERFFKQIKFLALINKLTDPHEKQYYQIIRKFQDSFTLVNEIEPKHFIVRIRPLLYDKEINLHFQFIEEKIEIEVDARKYPEERATFKILNESIPIEYKQKFSEYLHKEHKKKNLFDTLKLVQNGFERIYEISKFILENQFFSQKEIERKLRQGIKTQEGKDYKLLEKGEKEKPKKKESTSKNKNRPVVQIPYRHDQKIQNLHFGYQLTVESLIIQNCQYIVVQKVLLYLECVCQKQFLYVLDAGQQKDLKIGIKLQCRKCQILIQVALEREVVQVRHQSLGRIGVNNGKLVDVGGIAIKIGCNCDREISNGRLFLPGERVSVNCHNCFQTMMITYMGLKFFNAALKQAQMQSGHELPLKGACKHVKLSFRWFRYGCCGRVFSCDDCHLIGSVSVHQKVKGITMLCGFCSIEQAVSNDCVHCKKQVVKGVDKSGHWQGGLGCRDQTLLSKKDAKKFSGLTKKK